MLRPRLAYERDFPARTEKAKGVVPTGDRCARECIPNCPLIKSRFTWVYSAATPRPPMAPRPGGLVQLGEMMAMCAASYDCDGPQYVKEHKKLAYLGSEWSFEIHSNASIPVTESFHRPSVGGLRCMQRSGVNLVGGAHLLAATLWSRLGSPCNGALQGGVLTLLRPCPHIWFSITGVWSLLRS